MWSCPAPRLCPQGAVGKLFAWNGEQYAFVSDVLGVGGISYSIGPGQYSTPRPRENFLLLEGLLQAKNHRYELKIAEPMEENA